MKKLLVTLFVILAGNLSLAAGWSGNLGWNNPSASSFGLNFMHLWSDVAFEFGFGNVTNTANQSFVLGGANLKYIFSGSSFRPYLQAGTSIVISNSTGAVTTNVGGGYAGAGFFYFGNPWYLYASYNTGGAQGFGQYGLGFNF